MVGKKLLNVTFLIPEINKIYEISNNMFLYNTEIHRTKCKIRIYRFYVQSTARRR